MKIGRSRPPVQPLPLRRMVATLAVAVALPAATALTDRRDCRLPRQRRPSRVVRRPLLATRRHCRLAFLQYHHLGPRAISVYLPARNPAWSIRKRWTNWLRTGTSFLIKSVKKPCAI